MLLGKDRINADNSLDDFDGILEKYNNFMDHEYHLDQSTYLNDFDRNWRPKKYTVVFRNQLRSVDRSRFATRSTISLNSVMEGNHVAVINMIVQDDYQARRLLADIGYAYQISASHRAGVSMTVEQYKPDLDWTFFYDYSGDKIGSLNLKLIFLDFANNLIFDTIGVDPVLDDVERSYSSIPILLAFNWKKYLGNWKLGLAGGFQTLSESSLRGTGLPDDSAHTIQRNEWWFVGSELVFKSELGQLTTFATYHDELTRDTIAPNDFGAGNFDFRVFRNLSAGLKFLKTFPSWVLSANFVYDSYQDSRIRTLEPVHSDKGFRQREKLFISDLRHNVGNGKLFLGAGVAFQWRSFAQLEQIGLPFRPNPFNSRATVSFGIDFREDALIEFGTSFDLDGDQFYTDRGPTRFDGAFGRVLYSMN